MEGFEEMGSGERWGVIEGLEFRYWVVIWEFWVF